MRAKLSTKRLDDEGQTKLKLVDSLTDLLSKGQPARTLELSRHEWRYFQQMNLLSAKPYLFVCNVSPSHLNGSSVLSEQVESEARRRAVPALRIAVLLENDIVSLYGADMSAEQLREVEHERRQLLQEAGVERSSLDRVVAESFRLLGLRRFYTVGPQEARAWNIKSGTNAKQAAGTIHSDIGEGFIKAEVVAYDDYVACNGDLKAAPGKNQVVGANYEVQDGDICLFKFNG
jgi:ribosome-binding ATPase YchF (GTP1/OBG family)